VLEEAPPRGLGERLLALGRFLRLAPLPPRELARLARLSRERDLPSGESLATQGAPVRFVQFVATGKVALSRDGIDFLVIEAPDTVGLLPLAAATPFPYGARALEPVHIVDVAADLVRELLEDDFDFFLRVLRQGAEAVMRRSRRELPAPTDGTALSPAPDADVPLGAAERLLLLRRTELFGRCPVDGLASFAKGLQEVRVAAGEPLLRGAGDLAVVVASSSVSPSVSLSPSAPASAGAVFGVVEGLAGAAPVDPPPALRAAGPLLLLRGSTSHLLDTLEDHHAMGRCLLARLLELLVQA
jgi:hypothetical protein